MCRVSLVAYCSILLCVATAASEYHPLGERRRAMRQFVQGKTFAVVILIPVAFAFGVQVGEKAETALWVGRLSIGAKRRSIDPGLTPYSPKFESTVRSDIEIGLRPDGVVVWRRRTVEGGFDMDEAFGRSKRRRIDGRPSDGESER